MHVFLFLYSHTEEGRGLMSRRMEQSEKQCNCEG